MMEYMDGGGMAGGMGLSNDQADKVLQFQELTGIEDISVCRDVLQRHQWNLEVAVHEQLNRREGKPSVYASEARPPAVVSDYQLTQHVFYTPPTDGSASGFRGFVRNFISFFWSLCYNTVVSLLEFGRRLTGGQPRNAITNPTQDVMSFIKAFEERYGTDHPVFYQGTYSQVLNDAKRELKFLLIYLHGDDETVDTARFCTQVLANGSLITYVNQNFLFWGCTLTSQEGQRVAQIFRPGYQPFLAVVVLKDGRMTIVSRMEGWCDSATLVQRLSAVVTEYEHWLVQARADRVEQSVNRSLRAYQDEAFAESLRQDQEKERKRREERAAVEEAQRQLELEELAERERKASIARDKIDSVTKVPDEPHEGDPQAILLVIKLPCGTRLYRRFLPTHSLEAVYFFVFCHPQSPDSFEITTNFPKRVLQCRPGDGCSAVLTIAETGLKNKEMLFITDLEA